MGEGRDRQSWLLQELLGGLWTFRHPASEQIWCQAELAQWIDNILTPRRRLARGTQHILLVTGRVSSVQPWLPTTLLSSSQLGRYPSQLLQHYFNLGQQS